MHKTSRVRSSRVGDGALQQHRANRWSENIWWPKVPRGARGLEGGSTRTNAGTEHACRGAGPEQREGQKGARGRRRGRTRRTGHYKSGDAVNFQIGLPDSGGKKTVPLLVTLLLGKHDLELFRVWIDGPGALVRVHRRKKLSVDNNFSLHFYFEVEPAELDLDVFLCELLVLDKTHLDLLALLLPDVLAIRRRFLAVVFGILAATFPAHAATFPAHHAAATLATSHSTKHLHHSLHVHSAAPFAVVITTFAAAFHAAEHLHHFGHVRRLASLAFLPSLHAAHHGHFGLLGHVTTVGL
mmetsp:Transcript_11787/g.31215  ORF Transcript_11787/g.31215 Transcript_11787/m.31215 type:complete len:297 (-) Transcript_11787:78-968(-)